MPPSRNIVSAPKKQKSGRETRFGGVPYSETGLQHIIYIGKHHFGHFGRFQKKLGSDFLFHLPVTRQVDSENSGTTCRARVSRRSYPAPDPGPSTWTCFPGTPPPFLISRDRTPYQIPDLDLLPWTPFSYHKFQSSRYWGGV